MEFSGCEHTKQAHASLNRHARDEHSHRSRQDSPPATRLTTIERMVDPRECHERNVMTSFLGIVRPNLTIGSSIASSFH